MTLVRWTLPASLFLLMGCPGSSEDLTEAILEIEATAYDVCVIDVMDRMHCADHYGESWGFEDMVLGSNSYIELDSNQAHMCAIEDNDGDGAGPIHCFKLETLGLADSYDVYEGPYTSFSINQNTLCAIDLDGAVVCPDAVDGSGLESPPEGVFEDLWTIEHSFVTGGCALTAGGELECFGDEGFWSYVEACPLPTEDVVDMDVGGYPMPIALTGDGTLQGWSKSKEACVSEVDRGATLVETGQHVVCTLDDLGEISCIDINTDPEDSDVDEDSILENAPEGSYHQLAGNPNNVGMFMCASQGHEVSCWGDGWNDGVPQTFDFAD